jgi:serine/threonine protein kinase
MSDTNSHTAPGSSGADGEDARHREAAASDIRARGPVLLGKYELLKRVRVGGMAEVFRARDPARPDQLVAIKRILPSFTDEADYVAMFIDEAQLSARFQHRCIAAAIELGRADDELYLAMEYVDGLDLGSLLRRARARGEPLPVAIACRIASELCSALEYAHDLCDEQGTPLGIVHRDVSPQNVLVSFAGEVKLIDFGIAKSTEQRMRTAAGLLKGKYGYLSPEQAQGHEVDRRSDLFSLGVCLYEMLSAQRLFLGATDFSTIGRVRKAEVPPLRDCAPDVPEELAAIVLRALARDRSARYQTAGELGAALDAFIERSGERCEPAALGDFVRAAAEDPQAAEPASDSGAQGDPGTGLLDAFDDVEPVSAVSVLAEPPAPFPFAKTGDDDELFDTMREERLADPPEDAAPGESEPSDEALRSRGDATGEDLLEELSTDERTQVLPYESASNAGLAAGRAGASAGPADRPAAEDGGVPAVGGAPAGELAASSEPATTSSAARPVVHATTLPGIGMDWDDEELSTQLYDPPEPGQAGPRVSGALSLPRSTPAPMAPFAPAPSFPPGPLGAADVLAPAASAATVPATALSSGGTSVRPGAAAAPAGLSTLPPGARAPLLPRTGLAVWVVAGVLALAAVGVPLALWVTRAPARGTMHLTTNPPDAMVKLDGVPSVGRSSPFVLSNVIPDVNHAIEVSKPGHRTWTAQVTLAPGQIVQLPHVELAPIPSVAAVAPVEIPAEAPPPPALVPQAPAQAEQVQPPQPVRPDPKPRARPRPVANPKPRPSAAPVEEPAPPVRSEPAVTRSEPEPHEPSPQAAPQPAAEGAPGILRINSRPWSRVFVDGRLIGTTPQMKITLGAGLHTVTLVNPDFGLQKVLSVQIAPGETVTKIIELSQ